MNGRNDGFKWVWIGLAGMFILIGVATVLEVVMSGGGRRVLPPTNSTALIFDPWSWIWNLIGLFFFLWVLFFIVRFFFRPWRWHDHHHMHDWNWWEHDRAEEILRERYAKGEITKEQLDKMMDDIHSKRGMNL